jgi:hypothetical protein
MELSNFMSPEADDRFSHEKSDWRRYQIQLANIRGGIEKHCLQNAELYSCLGFDPADPNASLLMHESLKQFLAGMLDDCQRLLGRFFAREWKCAVLCEGMCLSVIVNSCLHG